MADISVLLKHYMYENCCWVDHPRYVIPSHTTIALLHAKCTYRPPLFIAYALVSVPFACHSLNGHMTVVIGVIRTPHTRIDELFVSAM